MEFVEAIQKGNPQVWLSRIFKIHQEHEDHFQEMLHDVQLKFEELKDFENFDIEIKKVVKEPKRKRATGAADVTRILPNDSVCTTDLKEPLCSSTPTETSTVHTNKEDCVKQSNTTLETIPSIEKTPISEFKCSVKGESVKKRIEEFEKRAAAASSASKIPILTPVKKNFVVSTASKNLSAKLLKEERAKPQICIEKAKDVSMKPQIYIEKIKEVPTMKPRLTRNNSKILQEKNTNIKVLKEKIVDQPIKKPIIRKASTDETRKKKEVSRKPTINKEMQEKEKRDMILKQEREKEKEAKIRAIQKQKEEKLLMLKKKQLGTITKSVEISGEKLAGKELSKCPKVKILESYDIEDVVDGASTDEEDDSKKQIPSWATKENRKHQLCAQAWMDKKDTVYIWFYNRRLKYPKVEELFSVGVKTRPRTSSAVWNNSSICF